MLLANIYPIIGVNTRRVLIKKIIDLYKDLFRNTIFTPSKKRQNEILIPKDFMLIAYSTLHGICSKIEED